MTTYQPRPATIEASWIAAFLRDIAIVLAVVVYVIDTL